MSLVVGQNSLVSVNEANAYLEDRVYSENWFSLPATPAELGGEAKETFLVTSFRKMAAYTKGLIQATASDSFLKNIQIDLAFYFVNNLKTLDAQNKLISLGLKRFKASKREEEYHGNGVSSVFIPQEIAEQLDYYLNVSGQLVDLEEV